MIKKLFVIILFPILFIGFSAFLLAQFGQTGALNGTVKDPDGLPLPGVNVTIKSPAIVLASMSQLTNQQGIYRFPSLPPGTYEITYELQGMNTLVRKDIKISAGETKTIDVVLQMQTLEESVIVVGKAPIIDIQSSTHTTNLDKDFLASIPAPRVLDTYFNMIPGVVAEPNNPNGLMSSAQGSSIRDNSFNLDGVNMTEPDVGIQRIELGMDVMEELSVQSGGLPAEFGDTTGTLINVVTKSGGNRFGGSASFYFNHEKFQSNNTKGTPLEGGVSGYRNAIEPGIALGGPIVKDRLWFFTNLSLNRRLINIPGYPYDQPKQVPADELRLYPYVKFTFQPNQQNKFNLSFNYANFVQNHNGASKFMTETSTLKWDQPRYVLNLQWTRFFSNRFFMDFKFGYFGGEDNLKPKNNQPAITDIATNCWSGGYGLADLYANYRVQLNTDGTYFKDDWAGSHEFKAGAEFQKTGATRDLAPNRDPRNQMSLINTSLGMPLSGLVVSPVNEKYATTNIFAFLQDSWRPAKRLTLNLGLRFSYHRSEIPVQNEKEGPVTFLGVTFNRSVTGAFTPMKRTNLSPRLGLIYDLTGDQKTLFKGSYSRYIQANLIVCFLTANPNGWFYYAQALSPDWTPVPDAYLMVNYPTPATVGYGDEGIKSPRTDEVTVSLERELFTDWSISLRYMRKWERNLLEDVNASELDIDKLVKEDELIWTNWEQVYFTDLYDGQQKYFWNQKQILPKNEYILNPPGAKRDYDGFEAIVNKRYSRGWSLMASYVWQNSRGLIGTDWFNSFMTSPYYDSPNAHINAVGRLPLERRHQLKILGMVKGPWGINVSGFFRYFSGQRYTRQVNSYDLGISLNQPPETIFAEPRGASGLPALSILDLRLEKTFRIDRFTLGIFVDGFNLFNGNKATQVQTISSSPALKFGEMTFIQDPRIFRLGTRFEF